MEEATMTSNLLQLTALCFGLAFAAQASASWIDVTDAGELRALHSNTTLKGRAANGEIIHGHFYDGGLGTMIVDGARMRTPWHLNGHNEMCIDWQEGSECFRYQKTGESEVQYRALRVRDGLVLPVSIEKSAPEY
jgi:hypothetical protein